MNWKELTIILLVVSLVSLSFTNQSGGVWFPYRYYNPRNRYNYGYHNYWDYFNPFMRYGPSSHFAHKLHHKLEHNDHKEQSKN